MALSPQAQTGIQALGQISSDLRNLANKISNYADDFDSLTAGQKTAVKALLTARVQAVLDRLTTEKDGITSY